MLTVDFTLITHRPEGIRRIAAMTLPQIEGVRYIISWQAHEDYPVPISLLRNDIEVWRLDAPGISANRNNVISHCSADIIIISDDDVILYEDGIKAVRKIYEDNPDLDLATFVSLHGDMSKFPQAETPLTLPLPKGYSVASVEMSFRNRGKAAQLRFCPEFGLGSGRYTCGEDELFLLSAIKRGLDCRFFPITVCAHPLPSTGMKRLTTSQMKAQGAVIALTYGASAILRIPLKAWRLSRNSQSSFFKALIYNAVGALQSRSIRRHNSRYLW